MRIIFGLDSYKGSYLSDKFYTRFKEYLFFKFIVFFRIRKISKK